MFRVRSLLLVWLPVASAIFFLAGLAFDHSRFVGLVQSETGPVELGTAALFVAAASFAVAIAWRVPLPRPCRIYYVLFASAALFVACEEVSWGQHLVGWRSPQWFAVHNKQDETNLHNLLGSKPSSWLRESAYVVFTGAFLVLPLVARKVPGSYAPGGWAYYLLPKLELAALIVLSLVITAPNKLHGIHRMGGALRELTELYQGWAAAGYGGLLWRRLARGVAPRAT
ncbi:MAG: hypothetical protein QOD06_2981 [Candidatus Binatota bacterium]|nr:hypothetical protein [Candidatus Binatota bacterium]